jgi:amidase
MGRTVADVALMLDAQAVWHPMDPLSLPPPSTSFGQSVARPKAPARVAFSPDLGVVPVEPELKEICSSAARRFGELGATVEEACPDLSDAREIFHVLRAHHLVGELAPVIEAHHDRIKPEVIWNFEEGLKLGSGDIARAERSRAALYYRVVEFFRRYDLLLTPATAVSPFDVDERYVTEVAGQKLETYYDWYWICYAITVTSCPALSVPCGFTASGLPVGLQMVGPPRGEASVLEAAAMFEELMGISGRLPIEPRTGSV